VPCFKCMLCHTGHLWLAQVYVSHVLVTVKASDCVYTCYVSKITLWLLIKSSIKGLY
jgi:hypothetical protein